MNLIYEDYCKTLVTIRHTTEVMEIENMLDPNGSLVDHLDNKLKDKDNDNNSTAAAERMQRQANNEINALQYISKLSAANNILKWHVLRDLSSLKKLT